MTGQTRGTDDRGGSRPKSVLFCANCEYESPVDGDWVAHERRGSRSVWYGCPACGHAVSVRPAESLVETEFPMPMSAPSPRRTTGTEFLTAFWDTYRHATTAWLDPWRAIDGAAD